MCLEGAKGPRKQVRSPAVAGAVGEVSPRFKDNYCLLPGLRQLGSGSHRGRGKPGVDPGLSQDRAPARAGGPGVKAREQGAPAGSPDNGNRV